MSNVTKETNGLIVWKVTHKSMSNVTKETNGLMTKYSYSEKTLMTCYKRKWIILDKEIM
jgi:hypothetical protein